ncbi:MAG: hypothetical protein AABW86_03460 [Candidatus Micrarchaeota archaeon]
MRTVLFGSLLLVAGCAGSSSNSIRTATILPLVSEYKPKVGTPRQNDASKPEVASRWGDVSCSSPDGKEVLLSYRGGRKEIRMGMRDIVDGNEEILYVVCDRQATSVVTSSGIYLFCGAEDLFYQNGELTSSTSIDFDGATYIKGTLSADGKTLAGIFVKDGMLVLMKILLTEEEGIHFSTVPLLPTVTQTILDSAKFFTHDFSDAYLVLTGGLAHTVHFDKKDGSSTHFGYQLPFRTSDSGVISVNSVNGGFAVCPPHVSSSLGGCVNLQY